MDCGIGEEGGREGGRLKRRYTACIHGEYVIFSHCGKFCFGVLLSLGQSGGMTRFVSDRLFLFPFFFHYRHHHSRLAEKKEQTGSAALLPASTFT